MTQIKDFAEAAVRFYERQGAAQLEITTVGARGDGKSVERTMNRLLGR